VKYANPNDYENKRSMKTLVVIITVIGLGVFLGVGVYGLLTAPHDEPTPTVAPLTAKPSSPSPTTTPVPATSDSEAFARWAATTLFTWDNATMNPGDVTDKLMTVADPLGEESAGLASDITNYLPDPQTWVRLRGFATRQWLDIKAVTIPQAWEQAVADAADGQILPGTTAYTISGTRHREGIYNNQPTSYTETVTFTMFVTCGPSFPKCHLMRLSLPDEPLK
jgi:hypothetical protein